MVYKASYAHDFHPGRQTFASRFKPNCWRPGMRKDSGCGPCRQLQSTWDFFFLFFFLPGTRSLEWTHICSAVWCQDTAVVKFLQTMMLWPLTVSLSHSYVDTTWQDTHTSTHVNAKTRKHLQALAPVHTRTHCSSPKVPLLLSPDSSWSFFPVKPCQNMFSVSLWLCVHRHHRPIIWREADRKLGW